MSDLQSSLAELNQEFSKTSTVLEQSSAALKQGVGAVEESLQSLRPLLERLPEAAEPARRLLSRGREDWQQASARQLAELASVQSESESQAQRHQASVDPLIAAFSQLSLQLQQESSELASRAEQTQVAQARLQEQNEQSHRQLEQHLTDLDDFIHQQLFTLIEAQEQRLEQEFTSLTRWVNSELIASLQKAMSDHQLRLRGVLETCRLASQRWASAEQTHLDEILTQIDSWGNARLENAAQRAHQASSELQNTTQHLREASAEEEQKHQAFLEWAQAATPESGQLQAIPPRLQEVLRKARVIR